MMDAAGIESLDVDTLIRRKRVETTEEVVVTNKNNEPRKLVEVQSESDSRDKTDEAINELDSLSSQIIEVGPNIASPNKENTLKDILEKYNKKYNTNLEYTTLTDALDLAVSADKSKSELTNAIVNNSIVAAIDYTTFSMIILVCQQINGVVSELLNDVNISPEARITLVDRLFLWINRLQSAKAAYSKMDIDHLIRKFERSTSGSSNNAKLAVNKLLSLLKLDNSPK